MKKLIIHSVAVLLILTSFSHGQVTRPTPPERVEAIRDARLQRAREARAVAVQQARSEGRVQARTTRLKDRAFMAVWTSLAPEVRGMPNARELAERMSGRPEWKTRTRAQRIATVTDFITNYPAIREARQQSAMDSALAAPQGEFPAVTDAVKLADELAATLPVIPGFEESGDPVVLAASVEQPDIDGFPEAVVPDLFTINVRFNWKKPHGQWMNQMLKDIDAAKAAGDAERYRELTARYTAWADQYLREDR